MKILIGTNNENKLAQFRRIFAGLDGTCEIFSPKDLGISEDVEEDGRSLLENARKKAEFYAKKSRILTLADDLGLFVDALGGEPGIHARRWHAGSDRDRCLKLIERLKGAPPEKRTCHYLAVLAAYDPASKKNWSYEQKLDGMISDEFRGDLGFGYDPIFRMPDGRHYAEYSDSERYAISHRGRGAKEFLKFFNL